MALQPVIKTNRDPVGVFGIRSGKSSSATILVRMNTYLASLFGLEGKVALLIGAGGHLVSMKTTRVEVVAGQLGFVMRILGKYCSGKINCALLGCRETQVMFVHKHDYGRPTTRIH